MGSTDLLPAAASVPPVPPAGTTMGRTDRLSHLFRSGTPGARSHPLLPSLCRHRGEVDVQPAPASPRSSRPMTAAVAAAMLQPQEVRCRVSDLPPLPQAALRALAILRRDDASLTEVAEHLGVDASLTARVMRLANSPFYGVPGRVASARDAAQVLGRRTLDSVLTLAAMAGRFEGCRSRAFDAAAFWRHALGTALAAQRLAAAAGIAEDRAFAAGLLHDIGLLAMSVHFPDTLDALIAQALADDEELCAVEQRLGVSPHAEIGAWIAAHWHFPASVVQAIGAHHQPGRAGRDDAALAACVHVGSAIAHALDLAGLPHDRVPPLDAAAWQRVALDEAALLALYAEVESGVHALCAALAV